MRYSILKVLPETCASKKKGTNDVGSSLLSLAVWQFGSLEQSLAEQFGQPNCKTAFSFFLVFQDSPTLNS